jgi:RNA polymerase sigma-70 factor (ECF subfamily)
MTELPDFARLLAQVRNGDEAAAAELVRCYEPEIRRFIRFRLSSPSLRRVIDSVDVFQSVLANFFVHVGDSDWKLESPDQLRTLLITMAKNKLYDHVRKQHAGRRDGRRIEIGTGPALEALADGDETPSAAVAADELVLALRNELSEDEQFLVDQRLSGREWSELAATMGVQADALRKRMTRALDRAATKLGLIRGAT